MDGKSYMRDLRADGSLHFFIEGKKYAGWNGYSWAVENGEAVCKKADGTVFERHRLNGKDTLAFSFETWSDAKRKK